MPQFRHSVCFCCRITLLVLFLFCFADTQSTQDDCTKLICEQYRQPGCADMSNGKSDFFVEFTWPQIIPMKPSGALVRRHYKSCRPKC